MADTPYQILGDEGIRDLATAFYAAMERLPEASTIRDMHGEDLSEVSDKLCDYLTGWMGGPPRYQEKTGTVCLTDPHAHYHIGPDETAQWLLCMRTALDDIEASDELKQMLDIPLQRIAAAVQNKDSSERPPRDPSIIAMG